MKLNPFDPAVGRVCDRAAEDLLLAIEQAESRAIGRTFNFDEHLFMQLRDETVYSALVEIVEAIIERAP
jgi:hypothetical protein